MREILGKPLLEFLVERLQRVKLADAFIIATTTNDTDHTIVEFCQRMNVLFTRGSEHDVLARYYEAACLHHADVIVRVTSDCPLIDPAVIDDAIAFYRSGAFDYVSNALHQSYPYGMAAEVFSFQLLEDAYREAVAEPEREHVTPFIYRRPERYRIGHLIHNENLSHHRWTVDTQEDLELVRKIIEALYPFKPDFQIKDIRDLLNKHPEWSLINADVRQKNLGQ